MAGRELRRFPGLTAEDMEVLRELEPDAARAFEREIRRQLRSDQRHLKAGVAALAAASRCPTGRRIPRRPPGE